MSALLDSPTIDEPLHLAGGLWRLQEGRFEVDPGNPPLPGTVAAIPVMFAKPRTDWSNVDSPFAPVSWFLRINGARGPWLVTLGRWACIGFSLMAGYACFRWAESLYGFSSGLLALALWCFCPNSLAHGHLITGDVAASAFGIAALYALWTWLREPSLARATIAGLMLGFAQITKYLWVLLFLLWPMLWITWRLLERMQGTKTRWGRDIAHLAAMAALCLYVINLAYLFEGSFPSLSDTKTGQRILDGLESMSIPAQWLARVPLPFPEPYLRGIADINQVRGGGFCIYLVGQWRTGGAWWFYPYAFLLKLPLGTILILLIAAAIALGRRALDWKDELILLFPIAALLAFVTFSGVPQTLRYALPIVPLAYVWAGKAALAWSRGQSLSVFSILVTAALIGSVGSSLYCYPHSLSYFNEMVGGPLHGHKYLLAANFDWGQDLFFLKKWLQAHPQASAKPLHLAYHGFTPPEYAGIDATRVPLATDSDGPRPGWYAISADYLHGFSYTHPPGQGVDYEYFLGVQPVARAGYSIFIFHLNPTQANDLRQQLGLPPLPLEFNK